MSPNRPDAIEGGGHHRDEQLDVIEREGVRGLPVLAPRHAVDRGHAVIVDKAEARPVVFCEAAPGGHRLVPFRQIDNLTPPHPESLARNAMSLFNELGERRSSNKRQRIPAEVNLPRHDGHFVGFLRSRKTLISLFAFRVRLSG